VQKRCTVIVFSLIIDVLSVFAQDRPEVSVHKYFRDLYSGFETQQPARPVGEGYIIPPLDLKRTNGLKKEIFGYLPYWFVSRWNLIDYGLVSTVAYFSGEATNTGSVSTAHGWPVRPGDPSASADVINMIRAAHGHGVRVVLCVTNFTGSEIDAIVSSQTVRSTLISNVLSLVKAGSADGINIDFEGVLNSSKNNLTLFMKELADTFHTNLPGSQVSCAPADFDLRYNGGDWDLPALAPFVDLFFVQGYGYAYGGGPNSGPVGLLPNTPFWGGLNITTLIDNVVLARIDTSKIVLGLPHYGYRWSTSTPDAKSLTTGAGVAFYYPDALGYVANFGRQWDALAFNPWYRYQASGQWYQGWYDDPESMSYKYQFALDRNLHGIGMWSLGMDGSNHDIWDVLAYYFADSSTSLRTPRQPDLAMVKDSSTATEGIAYIRWFANVEPYLGGYRLYKSSDPENFPATPLFDENSLGRNSNEVFVGGLSLDSVYYFKVVAVDSSRTKISDTSDTYGVRLGSGSRYLIVDGFDRSTGSYSSPHHAFAASFGGPVASKGRYVDCADNDAVINGLIGLSGYAGVIWFLGDESVSDQTFNAVERDSVKSFLERGGKFFVTGSEIGYDLGRAASPNYNLAFYNGYFKANYAGDKAATLTFSGTVGSIFEGVSGQFGQVYIDDYPDYIVPVGGAKSALMYNASQTAAIQYAGTFGTGTVPGKLVYFGFAFETIASAATRDLLLGRAIDFFELTEPVREESGLPTEFDLAQNHPNPFNPQTTITYTVPVGAGQPILLQVYDLLGRHVATLVQEAQQPGRHSVLFDASQLASGAYLYRLEAGNVSLTRKMMVLK
jgi:spore germination protein YaaH